MTIISNNLSALHQQNLNGFKVQHLNVSINSIRDSSASEIQSNQLKEDDLPKLDGDQRDYEDGEVRNTIDEEESIKDKRHKKYSDSREKENQKQQRQSRMNSILKEFQTYDNQEQLEKEKIDEDIRKRKKINQENKRKQKILKLAVSLNDRDFNFLGERAFAKINKLVERYNSEYKSNKSIEGVGKIILQRHKYRKQIFKYCLLGIEELKKTITQQPERALGSLSSDLQIILELSNNNDQSLLFNYVKTTVKNLQVSLFKQLNKDQDSQLKISYKLKIEEILTNLKDESNYDFRQKIFAAQIDPKTIASMEEVLMMSETCREKFLQNSKRILAEADIQSQEKERKKIKLDQEKLKDQSLLAGRNGNALNLEIPKKVLKEVLPSILENIAGGSGQTQPSIEQVDVKKRTKRIKSDPKKWYQYETKNQKIIKKQVETIQILSDKEEQSEEKSQQRIEHRGQQTKYQKQQTQKQQISETKVEKTSQFQEFEIFVNTIGDKLKQNITSELQGTLQMPRLLKNLQNQLNS